MSEKQEYPIISYNFLWFSYDFLWFPMIAKRAWVLQVETPMARASDAKCMALESNGAPIGLQ